MRHWFKEETNKRWRIGVDSQCAIFFMLYSFLYYIMWKLLSPPLRNGSQGRSECSTS